MKKIKDLIRPLYWKLISQPWYRRMRTSGYTSGKIALGERNFYKLDRDWITVDIEGADFNVLFSETAALPFPDGSQNVIYSCHMVEHILQPVVQRILDECYRILRPGGHIRLEAPDAEKILAEYKLGGGPILRHLMEGNRVGLVEGHGMPPVYAEDHVAIIGALSSYIINNYHVPAIADKAVFAEKIRTLGVDAFGDWCVSLQTPEQIGTHGHVNVLYFDKLSAALKKAGFKNVTRRENGETSIAGIGLSGIERSGIDRVMYSFYIEAEK